MFIKLNNLIAKIWKVRKIKRIEKEIALTNSMKTKFFYTEMAHNK